MSYGYTDDCGYENRNVYVVLIIKRKTLKSLCWLFSAVLCSRMKMMDGLCPNPSFRAY
jgi:hypothetical protein